MADKTIEMLSVSPGQVIAIWASTHSLDLVEALAVRIRARGAFWTLRLTMESLLRRIGQSVPEPYLASVPEHELRWLADVSAIVEVRDHGGHILEVPLVRRRALAAEWIALIDEARRRGCRRIQVVNPTPALASAYGVPVEDLRQSYWRAVNVDYAALDRQQDRVAARLARARLVHVASALGTDLHLRIDDRPVHQDTDSLPRGEVYVAPHEDSAEGVAVIDRAFVAGKPIERLRLVFRKGRVVDASAADPSAAHLFRELLSASAGDKDVIAELAIGLNPGAAEPIGDVMLDEKIAGSCHIAIGMNTHFGGRNQSNLHLDLVMLRPTVRTDGEVFVDNGATLPSTPFSERIGERATRTGGRHEPDSHSNRESHARF
ncbi:MAG TPA: aminopeptidase [Anaerolineae bacterium]|nr:aminopeptidase [Anaerolineae bacterium]